MNKLLGLTAKVPFTIKLLVLGLALIIGARAGLTYADSSSTVSGTFTVNSVPIAGASVTINGGGLGGPQVATTDSNGDYSIGSLPAGSYQLAVSYSGANISGVPSNFAAVTNGDTLTVNGTDNVTDNLSFASGTQTVNVVDTNGNPVAGTGVTYQQSGEVLLPDSSYNVSSIYDHGSTDVNGNLSVPTYAGGNYQVCATDIDSQSQTCQYVGDDSELSTPITITVPALATVSGTFTVNSVPIPNASVTVNGSNLSGPQETTTDSNGNYSISSLPAGNYQVGVSYSGANIAGVPSSFGAATNGDTLILNGSNVNNNLSFTTGVQTVNVIDTNGNPVAGSTVTFQQSGRVLLSDGSYNISSIGDHGSTDSNGDFTAPAYAGGNYQVCATYIDSSQQACQTVDSDSLITPVTITVPALTTVSGTFTVNSVPIAGATVTINGGGLGGPQVATTDSNGNYSIESLPAGSYQVGVSYSRDNISGLPFNFGAVTNGDTLTVDGTDNVTDNLSFTTGTQTFSVVDTNGNPVAGSQVQVQQIGEYLLPDSSYNIVGLFSFGPTDSNGNIILPVYAGGSYRVCATLIDSSQQSCQTINSDNDLSTPITTTVPATTPSAPTNLTAASPTNHAPALTWNTVSGASSYNVYRNGTSIGSTTSPSYTDNSVTSDGTYSYSVTAVNTSGESPQSSPFSVVYDTTPPTVTITGVVSGETYNTSVTPVCNTSDSLSGVATNASLSTTNSGLSYTATCSGAIDNAGNSAPSVSATYTQLPSNYTLVNLVDSNGNALSSSKVVFKTPSGTAGTTYTDGFGNTYLNTTPGTTYTITVYYANGYVNETINPTSGGPNTVDVTTIPVTVTINDPSSQDIANASVAQAGNTGTFGSKVPVNSSGQVVFQVLPGTSTFTAYDAYGYEQQSLNVSSTNNSISFNTDTVQVTVTKNGNPLTTATVKHAGNTGAYSSGYNVDNNGQVTIYVLPGTNYFTAFDGSNYYTKETLNVTGNTSTTIAVN